jgi:2-methylaconitate cis-trans-isomerase PrpF
MQAFSRLMPQCLTMHRTIYSTANHIPATYLRGGTSKGIFLSRADLPQDEALRESMFRRIMGSPDPYGRQLNGMGGGVSSLSKICVIGEPDPDQRKAGIDVVYDFIQVGIHDGIIDISGNCGNLSSVVGVYAVDEGICKPRILSPSSADYDLATVTAFNTNTSKLVSTTFPVSNNEGRAIPLLELPQTEIPGVPGLASRIIMKFLSPAGALTGSLLPTNHPIDLVDIPEFPHPIRVSLVDATNPSVFVAMSDLNLTEEEIASPSPKTYAILEGLRQKGAELMRLDPGVQAQPKIAVLSHPDSSGNVESQADIVAHALSMGVLHRAIPLTVGLCLGVAANVKGTLVWEMAHSTFSTRSDGGVIRIRHPSGIVEVGAEFPTVGKREVTSATVIRTGRRLMKGVVWW